MDLIKKDISKSVDQLEASLLEMPQVDCPLKHTFTPGLYSRQIFMPKDSVIVSKIHKTEHQFVVSMGVAFVKVNDEEWEEIKAPYIGITKPGTRRVLVIGEDCIWTTFHPATEFPKDDSEESLLDAVAKIEERIILKHEIVPTIKL